jgi:hypothetical protein
MEILISAASDYSTLFLISSLFLCRINRQVSSGSEKLNVSEVVGELKKDQALRLLFYTIG